MTTLQSLFKRISLVTISIISLSLAAHSAKADIAFDTLDPLLGGVGGTDTFAGYPVTLGGTVDEVVAAPFSPIFDIELTTISPKIEDFFAATPFDSVDYTLSLYADNGSNELDPLSLLGSATTGVFAAAPAYVPFDFSSLNLTLYSGTQYWAFLSPSIGTETTGVWYNSTHASNFGLGTNANDLFYLTAETPLLIVEGSPVTDGDMGDANSPEALSLLALGLMGMGYGMYRRKKA